MNTILILVPRFGVGGISKVGTFLANTLSTEYRTILVSLVSDKMSAMLSNEVTRETLSYNFDDPSINRWIKEMQKVRTVVRLRYLIKKYNVDVICTLGLDLGKIANIAGKGLKCKYLTSERGNPYRYSSKQKEKYDRIVSNADAVIFQTIMAQKAFSNCGIERKSHIIQNPAIGRNSINYEKAFHNIFDREKRIVYCGRLSKEKNIDMLIKAYYKLKNHEYKLMIYGNGYEYEHLLGLIQKYKLSNCVSIVTDCIDVFSIEYNSEIFVLTSNEEGMPNALIEAMMCGMTCIVTDCPPGGCRELLEDGKRGILVPVNDVDKLADSLQLVISNRRLSEELGNRARDISITNSIDVIQEKWKNIIKGLV
ncbi:MAG: glycosyltransferase family 4 protein [Dorea sp.]|uniref:glycosyltransferase n=1 Tax=Sporofaciens sp. JLR.KK001 TaxID=3112621 RepID=UPI00216FDDA1|nr:glycosyltransferase family 4 protein [Dorea sp.]